MVWCGVVWCGVVWCGVVWCGVVWCGVVWCGVVWCGVVWCGVVWCGVVWCGVVWCGVVLCGVCVCVCDNLFGVLVATGSATTLALPMRAFLRVQIESLLCLRGSGALHCSAQLHFDTATTPSLFLEG